MKRLIFLALVVLGLSTCVPQMTPTSSATVSPRPSITSIPATSTPSATPKPSATPAPTYTPTPTRPALPVISGDNAASLTEQILIGDGRLSQVRFSPDGSMVAYASSIGIRLLAADGLKELGYLPSSIPVSAIDFSPDGSLLAAGYQNGRVILYHTNDLTSTPVDEVKPVLEIKAHTFWVTRVRFSHDGTLLATASRDRTANIWKVNDGARLRPLGGFALTVNEIVFSADDTLVSAGSLDGLIRIWEIKSGNMLAQTGTSDKWRKSEDLYPAGLALIGDGQTLLIGWADGRIQSWEWSIKDSLPADFLKLETGLNAWLQPSDDLLIGQTDTGITAWQIGQTGTKVSLTAIQILSPNGSVRGLDSTADGKTWTLGLYPAVIEVFHPDQYSTGKAYARTETGGQITAMALLPDGTTLVSSSRDGVLYFRDIDQPQSTHRLILEPGQNVEQILISTSGDWLAAAIGSKINIFNLTKIQNAAADQAALDLVKPSLTISTGGPAHRAAISADGSLLASSSLLSDTIQLWHLPEGKRLIDLTKFDHPIESLAFANSSNTLAAGAKDHRVFIWSDLDAGELSGLDSDKSLQPTYVKGGFVVTSLVWSADDLMLAVSGTLKQARVVNPLDGQARFYLNNGTDQLVTAAFSPDVSMVASSGADGVIRLYNTKDGKLITELSGHSGMVNCLLFTPDGERLISGGEDGTIRIWVVIPTE